MTETTWKDRNLPAETYSQHAHSRRSFMLRVLLPALAVSAASIPFTPAAHALSPPRPRRGSAYRDGYNRGVSVGRRHGYADGYKGSYRASFVDELLYGDLLQPVAAPMLLPASAAFPESTSGVTRPDIE